MAKKPDGRQNPVNEIERLAATATAEQVQAAQSRLIHFIEMTNAAMGRAAPDFEEAVRNLHLDPTLLRNIAAEFHGPVVDALEKAMA
jgi:hypothetical protein